MLTVALLTKKLHLDTNTPVKGLVYGEPSSINEVKPKLTTVLEHEYDFQEV